MAKIRLIDLGLPSGTKWGDRNFGADAPETEGKFVTWGGIESHTDEEGYFKENYEHWNKVKETHTEEFTVEPKKYTEISSVDPETGKETKLYKEMNQMDSEPIELPEGCHFDSLNGYIVDPMDVDTHESHTETRVVETTEWKLSKYTVKDGKKRLEDEDDAATVAFGYEYAIPTKEQWQELFDNTEMVVENGVAIFTALNGNSITLPLCGCRHEFYPCLDNWGEYWSKDLDSEENAVRTIFSKDLKPRLASQWRIVGLQIRPVLK